MGRAGYCLLWLQRAAFPIHRPSKFANFILAQLSGTSHLQILVCRASTFGALQFASSRVAPIGAFALFISCAFSLSLTLIGKCFLIGA